MKLFKHSFEKFMKTANLKKITMEDEMILEFSFEASSIFKSIDETVLVVEYNLFSKSCLIIPKYLKRNKKVSRFLFTRYGYLFEMIFLTLS